MRRIQPRNLFLLLLLVFCIDTKAVFCQSSAPLPDGLLDVENSAKLFTLLEKENFSPSYQHLVPSDDNSFPKNIIISLNAAQTGDNTSERTTIVFAFTAQFAFENKDTLCSFARDLKEKNLPYNVTLLISINDDSLFDDKSSDYHPKGTDVFTASIDNPDSYAAVIVEKNSARPYEIIPGGGGDTSPSWLVRTLRHACILCGKQPAVSTSFITLYRNGVLRENKRVSSFLRQEVPAASITITGSPSDFLILEQAATLLAKSRSDRWDRHYAFLPIGQEGVLLSESFFAISYLFFSLLSLFFLCFFSFTGKAQVKARMHDVFSICYIVPITLLLTALVLFLGELPFPKTLSASNSSPLVLFGIKTLITLLLTVIAFIMQIRLSYRVSPYSYGFFMTAIAAANIFIFSTVDLSLLFLFFFEYILTLLAERTKSLALQIVTFFLLFIPFVPYIIDLLRFASFEGLYTLIKCGFSMNILLALIFFPFQMQLFRIFLSLDIFSKDRHDSPSVVVLRSLATIIIILGTMTGLYAMFTKLIMRGNTLNDTKKEFISISKDDSLHDISIFFDETSFMELTARHLIISSKKKVLRYTVSIDSPLTVPLYDSNFLYTLENEHTAYFNLPDNPLAPVEIIYSADPQFASSITVQAYVVGDDDKVLLETKKIETKAGT